MSDMLDLTGLVPSREAQERGTDVEIRFDGKPVGLTIRVAGPDSERQTSVDDEIYAERMAEGSTGTATGADIRDLQLRKLARATISWTPEEFRLGGKIYKCDEKSARDLYESWPPIRRQVQVKAFDESPFIDGSAGLSVEPSEGDTTESP